VADPANSVGPDGTNDHSEWRWDEDILKSLAGLAQSVRPVGARLEHARARFAGYPERFVVALERVGRGERKWVDEPGVDFGHTVWFELSRGPARHTWS
jgi:hypothetical protein